MSTVKKTTTTTTSKASKAKKANAKKAKAKKPSAYRLQVLNKYSAFKQEQKSVSGAVRLLLAFRKEAELPQKAVSFLKETQRKPDAYKDFCKKVRTHKKTGTCSPFYVMQTLYREGLLK